MCIRWDIWLNVLCATQDARRFLSSSLSHRLPLSRHSYRKARSHDRTIARQTVSPFIIPLFLSSFSSFFLVFTNDRRGNNFLIDPATFVQLTVTQPLLNDRIGEKGNVIDRLLIERWIFRPIYATVHGRNNQNTRMYMIYQRLLIKKQTHLRSSIIPIA